MQRRANTRKTFWSYQASEPTPGYDEAVSVGAFKGTREQWEQLTPGMRREAVREAKRRAERDRPQI